MVAYHCVLNTNLFESYSYLKFITHNKLPLLPTEQRNTNKIKFFFLNLKKKMIIWSIDWMSPNVSSTILEFSHPPCYKACVIQIDYGKQTAL